MRVAALQLNAKPNIHDNITEILILAKKALDDGAELIATPENSCFIKAKTEEKLRASFSEENHPTLHALQNFAKENSVFISIGSLSIKISDTQMANRSFFINKAGEIIARYNKIHLFDVRLQTGEVHQESLYFKGGNVPCLTEINGHKIALSICYDVRFPELYRIYAEKGAEILLIPAAFTVPTGTAHWHTLLKARAIENQCFVIAAAQTGIHEVGRKTYGHSLIIDPWGQVLGDAGEHIGIITADLSFEQLKEVRSSVPCLMHRKIF